METHILIPRKQNIGKLTKVDVVVIWLLANKVETNWTSVIIHLLMERKRKNTWLPYGGWITKILEYCGFNLEDE